ncbi:MAG: MgtC/SapB family protein [Lentisphaeria bacterium]|nr:MgtC/SapB family protein [Lentisphaeria bacterium]
MLFSEWNWTFMMRLAIAGLLGAAIGFERECRAKEAGTRTHFLVAVSSCLMMIVSQWGFHDVTLYANGSLLYRIDSARVAAQIVSGIGFIGGGTIMMQKQVVHGLTTAAGLWAVAGIGMAIGGGLYGVGISATCFALIGLEALRYLLRKFRTRSCYLVFLTKDRSNLITVTNELNANDFHILSYSVSSEKNGDEDWLRVKMWLREHVPNGDNQVLRFMQQFPGIEIEKVE